MKIHKIWLLVIAHSLCISLLASEVAPAHATPAPAESDTSSSDDEAVVSPEEVTTAVAEHKKQMDQSASQKPKPKKAGKPKLKARHAKQTPPEQVSTLGLVAGAVDKLRRNTIETAEQSWLRHVSSKTVQQVWPNPTTQGRKVEDALNELHIQLTVRETPTDPDRDRVSRQISLLKSAKDYGLTLNFKTLEHIATHLATREQDIKTTRKLLADFGYEDDEKSSKKDNE